MNTTNAMRVMDSSSLGSAESLKRQPIFLLEPISPPINGQSELICGAHLDSMSFDWCSYFSSSAAVIRERPQNLKKVRHSLSSACVEHVFIFSLKNI